MILSFTKDGWDDFMYLLDKETKAAKKVRQLLKEIARTPFEGTGKPEALKHQLAGYWSRRIDKRHRLVYRIEEREEEEDICYIVQCRNHY